MAKRESTFINMVTTLMIITAVAAGVLGGVEAITREPIRQAKAAKLKKALSAVLPEFSAQTRTAVLPEGEKDSLVMYTATNEAGEYVGVAVETYSFDGFSGRFDILVGFLPDGSVNKTAVLSHKETPGLGDKMERKKADWAEQFDGKHPEKNNLTVKKDGGEIDAITASTITSRAFCDAVDRAYRALNLNKGGQTNE
jgi:electron transport complex protein RnfG